MEGIATVRQTNRVFAPARPRTTLALPKVLLCDLDGTLIEILPASHTVPACGYAVTGASGGAWVYTGDTGPNPALWQRLAAMHVEALVIETAFRDDEHALARISQHLCPERLREELAHLREPMDVYITHIKPGEVDAVMSEIGAHASRHRIHALASGEVMPIGG